MNIRRAIFYLLLLCVVAVRAQFRTVDWSGVRGDTLLPMCTQVVDLSADYAAYSYTAHIEYPEYQVMGDADVARLSIAEKYGALPEVPVVECHIGVQAKQAQLDVAFLPVVMRDGKYYRINSYKLVVDRQPVQRPQRAAASPAERYATSSVLATGKWVRVAVEENGVHKTLKSPVGTTKQFIEKMRAFYKMNTPVCGLVIFAEPDCKLTLPEEMDGIALLTPEKAITYIKNRAKKAAQKELFAAPEQILHCTRFYSRNSEFCKGMLADCFFDCDAADGSVVRIDTGSIAYLSVETQPLKMKDKLFVTFTNGATDVFYNRDTVFDVVCLDGTCQKIALHRVRHIVF